ncbi:MAG: CBS domain-containing protein [Candidatus Desulfaltia sp.]|nr:CBS domain-containing protein [Candidatus Desulfaltia sp.]
MIVKKLFRQDYTTIEPDTSVRSVEDRLAEHGFLVVIRDESFVGILTSANVLEYSHKLVVDCLREIPKIEVTSDLEPVFAQMKECHYSVLPVFRETTFIGVITLEDITDYYLFKYRKELEHEVEQRTAELKKINKMLQQEIVEHKQTWEKLCKARDELAKRIDILEGILPICSFCKNIRNEKGEWNQIEKYIASRSKAQFSHSVCPDCMKKHYPEFDNI